jgi:hypothetical protein
MVSFYSFRYWQILCGIICCVFVITGVTVAHATPELSSLLPAGVTGWTAAGQDSSYTRSTLFDYIDGGAELYLSYGFKDAINRRYTSGGKSDIVVDIFDMATAPNAFGVFSQSMETVEKHFGQGSQVSKGLLIFWKDRFYVSIVAHPETDESKKAIHTLAALIDKTIEKEGPLPAILSLLPEKSLVKESIRYFRHHAWLNAHYFIADHNLLHINDTTEALLAKYEGGSKRSLLLLVEYTDEQSAQQAYGDFVKSYLPNISGKVPVQIEDGTWTACHLSGNLFIAVFNAAQSVDASHLLDVVEKKKLLQKEAGNGKKDKKGVSER